MFTIHFCESKFLQFILQSYINRGWKGELYGETQRIPLSAGERAEKS